MTKKFIWVGSSWENGDELQLLLTKDEIAKHVFPSLVSAHFDAECLNVSENLTSIQQLIWQIKTVEQHLNQGDTVFFALPPPHWSMFVNDNGNLAKMSPNFHKDKRVHEYSQHWYRYFDNVYQQSWTNDIAIEFLANWCQMRGLNYYFYPQTNYYRSRYITNEINWLIPPSSCIAEFILPVIDNKNFSVITADQDWLTTEQWQEQQPYVEKYISPCYCHPNVEGHKKIAQEFIRILTLTVKEV